MKTIINCLISLIFIIIFANSSTAMTSGGGGATGPNFSDGYPGNDSGCGAGSLTNKGAGVDNPCHPDNVSSAFCPAKGSTDYYTECTYSTGGTCQFDNCACWGSNENTIYSQFCAPATGTFVFEVSNIACTGGAASLQFQVLSGTSSNNSICDMTSEFCNKGFTGDIDMSVDLASGTCYTLMFDGNAGADCTWDFNINCIYALGLTMVDYNVQLSKDETSVGVNWEVVDEFDVDHYEIHKSKNGVTFDPIGEIKAVNVGEKQHKYSFEDSNPSSGTSYYKLVEVEVDGREFNYDKHVITKRKQDLEIYPNPIKDDMNINFGNHLNCDAEISVYDVLGNLVYSHTLENKSISHKIDMGSHKKGVYFLFVKDGENLIQKKFYKD